ncbi:MAG TPA: bifunctional diaminohydroxyphosphoribosylaminopyrimidine deaminase/5-amino-6-(5-phosphoribosylamino)uracil reductase RibD [Planctomycetota bacterium]|nr:bifunctional diaminohydroxyphosphoribosylaminopyrimidine deaminase/5-amino-6-(5-phosphoribosylamino)uracil reductase RibD [Planctomycetota bacterium]
MRRPRAHARRLLERAAALAAAAALEALPDPPVGCVVADASGRVLGEGAHRGYGLPHAEPDALRAAGAAARGAAVFVSLEPCGRAGPGKRTAPCARALRDAGVGAVVYGASDPSPFAAGAGPALLREAGIAVEAIPSTACEAALDRWRRASADAHPWTIAKWAMSLDGRTGDARGGSRWISGEESRARAHAIRARCDAVVVGSRTAVLDDPDLRARGVAGALPLLRVVVDGALRLDAVSRLARTAREGPVLVATGDRAPPARRAALEKRGVEIAAFASADGRVDLVGVCRALRARGVLRLLLEGGGGLQAAAFRAGLVRQAAVFVAPLLLGGASAPSPLSGGEGLRAAADPLRLEDARVTPCGADLLVEGFVPR